MWKEIVFFLGEKVFFCLNLSLMVYIIMNLYIFTRIFAYATRSFLFSVQTQTLSSAMHALN
jgi:hypothetical protein